MGDPWLLAIAIGLGLLAVGVFASSFIWRRRLIWLRRWVSVLLLISSAWVGVVWWNTPPLFVNRRAPLAASALEYVATSDNTVSALQAATGQTVWRRTLAGNHISALRVEPGYIIVVSATSSDALVPPQGTIITGLDATTGQTRWQTPLPGYGMANDMFAEGISLNQGYLYLEGFYHRTTSTLISLDTTTGHIRWRVSPGAQFAMTSNQRPTIAADSNVVYVLVGPPQHYDSIQAIRASDGALLWRWLSTGQLSAYSLLAASGVVYALTYDQQIQAMRATDGGLLWRRDFALLGFGPVSVALQGGALYVNGVDANQNLAVYALNTTDGSTRWRRTLGPATGFTQFGNTSGGVTFDVLLSNGLVIVNDRNGIFCVNAATGASVWQLPAADAVLFELDSTYNQWTNPEDRVAPIVMGTVLFIQAVLVDPVPPFTIIPPQIGRLYIYAVSLTTGQPYWRIRRGAVRPAFPAHITL